jgi:DNA repair protein RecO (recombination protein O)
MSRERTIRTEGVVLKRTDFGEADRLLTLFSPELGKVKAVAKGARKPQSRKTGHVELFMRSKFLIAEGRDLGIVTQAETIDTYAPLREDLVRATYAGYFVELLDRFTVEEDPHRDMYDLLVRSLGCLADGGDPLLAARYFELRLLSLAGFQPRLFNCVSCGEAIREEDQFFSAELGGLLCPNDRPADMRSLPVSAAAVKVMRYLQTRPPDAVYALRLPPPLLHEIERVMHAYLTHTLERALKSVDFLHRLRREASLFSGDDPADDPSDEPA